MNKDYLGLHLEDPIDHKEDRQVKAAWQHGDMSLRQVVTLQPILWKQKVVSPEIGPAFSFVLSAGFQSTDWCCSHLGWCFTSHLT